MQFLLFIYIVYIYVCVCIYIICILKTPFEEKHWDFSDRRTLSLWNELSFFQTARVIFTQVKYDVKALVYVYDTYGQYCINTGWLNTHIHRRDMYQHLKLTASYNHTCTLAYRCLHTHTHTHAHGINLWSLKTFFCPVHHLIIHPYPMSATVFMWVSWAVMLNCLDAFITIYILSVQILH